MSTERRRIDSLRDIVKYCDQVEQFLVGFTQAAFEADRRTYNAVLYSLQTVGEAAIRLDKEERRLGECGLMERLYPDVPWRDVRGLSSIVRHVYDELDVRLIWTTATGRISPVRDAAHQEIVRLQQDDTDEARHGPTRPR
ncbi:HepT-like ribonuclease domain-containing protein [Bradyrhizobium japonicum]|uniref:HepT-like ribonuclease domain-containing protein n=1 Tax=Bradyrhizobium japonicum TaxID=375 RepID=UPI000415767C|nr:DUF86 domain-containing protein [Bradyrhizobium japonicum]